MPNGIAIAQTGVAIETAADYKKVMDSRWKMLEVAFYGSIDITLPYIAPGATTQSQEFNQKLPVMSHSLGFYPLYEVVVELLSGTPALYSSTGNVYADKNSLYLFPRYQYDQGQAAVTYRINYRVFNLDIEDAYVAPTGTFQGDAAGPDVMGAKFLDGSGLASVDMDSTLGFSMDTTKKILGVQAVINQRIQSYGYSYVYHYAGYPPSYLVCELPSQIFKDYGNIYTIPFRDDYFSSPMANLLAFTVADNEKIGFHGVQAEINGNFCFVILKDPVSIAS